MADVQNTTSIDQLEEMYNDMQELQGYGADDAIISYQEYAEMTDEQREAYLESFIAQAELTDEEATQIEEALSEKLDEYHDMLREARAYLEQIVGDSSADTSLVARSQVLLEDVNELIEGTDAREFSEDWGNSLDAVQDRNQTIETRGTTTSVNTNDAEHGDVYTIDATKMEDAEGASGSTSYFDDYENAQTEDWAYNEDTNGDGVIDERDNPEFGETPTTIDLSDIPNDAQVTASVENGDPTVVTLHVVEEDGTKYDIQLILDPNDIEEGNLRILLAAVPTNVDNLPKEINGIFYEQSTSDRPYSHYTHDYRPTDNNEAQSIYELSDDYPEHTHTITADDFNQSREITVDYEETVDGTFTIDVESYEEMLGEEVSVSFAMGSGGSMVITLTTESGKTVTITINNFYPHDGGHKLKIEGGTITSTESEIQRLERSYKSTPSSTSGYYEYMAQHIYHDGRSLYSTYGGSEWPEHVWTSAASSSSSEEMSEIERQAQALGYDLDEIAEKQGKTKEQIIEEIEAALAYSSEVTLESVLDLMLNGLPTI